MAYEEKELLEELTKEIFRIKSEKQQKKIFNLFQKLLDGISHESSERAKIFRQKRTKLLKRFSQGYRLPIILYREDVRKIKEYFLLIMQIQRKFVSTTKEDLEVSTVNIRGNRKKWICNECSNIMKLGKNRLIISITYSNTFNNSKRQHIFSFCCEKCVEKFIETLDGKISQCQKDITAINKSKMETEQFWAIPENTPDCGQEFDPEDD